MTSTQFVMVQWAVLLIASGLGYFVLAQTQLAPGRLSRLLWRLGGGLCCALGLCLAYMLVSVFVVFPDCSSISGFWWWWDWCFVDGWY